MENKQIKYILSRVIHNLFAKDQSQNDEVSEEHVATKPVTNEEKGVIAYMGGYVLRKLYYKTKDENKR